MGEGPQPTSFPKSTMVTVVGVRALHISRPSSDLSSPLRLGYRTSETHLERWGGDRVVMVPLWNEDGVYPASNIVLGTKKGLKKLWLLPWPGEEEREVMGS